MNMLVPGQCEKWILLCNINQFSLRDLPVMLFKKCVREVTCNYIDYGSRTNIVNMSWF